MTTTPKRWRPRFSLRTLVVVVTLVCVYFGLWEVTKRRGVKDVMVHRSGGVGVEPTPSPAVVSFDAIAGVPLDVMVHRSERVDPASAIIGLFRASATMPLVVRMRGPFERKRTYYFWFFGYVAKLPFERTLPLNQINAELRKEIRAKEEALSRIPHGGFRLPLRSEAADAVAQPPTR